MSSLVRCLLLLLVLVHAAPHRIMAQQSRADTLVVHFAFDRSNITSADSALLGHTRPDADSILVLGYTDTLGSEAYNRKLSYRRALAAQTVLLQSPNASFARVSAQPQATIPPIRLDARGESDPLPGDDSLSRRVAVIIYYRLPDTPTIAKDTPQARPDNEPDTVFGLDNINFIANTATLTPAAREALPHVVAYLKSFSDRYLEIDGFCNQPGPPLKPNHPLFILSVQRAKFIYDYLTEQGFDSTHLRYKGMGNANPVISHPTTAKEMDENMRVEIKVFRKPQTP